MPRSVNAVASRARRKKIIKQAKGFFGRRKNVWTVAKNAVEKAMQYAYRGRKEKKRNFRSLWIMRINAGAREHGMSYSQFMGALKKNNIELNRKVLADLAMNSPEAFKAVVDQVRCGLSVTVNVGLFHPHRRSDYDSTSEYARCPRRILDQHEPPRAAYCPPQPRRG